MPFAFYSTTPNLRWAVNRLNNSSNSLFASIANIIAGAGSVVNDPTIEAAVQWLVNKASNNYITYSQTNRNLKNPAGTSFDCSSFIITGFYAVGLDINATNTRDMVAGFTAAGWKFIEGATWTSNQLERGDIMVKAGVHTQMYIGNNQDVNCGSTPAGVETHSVDNYGRGWDGILRH